MRIFLQVIVVTVLFCGLSRSAFASTISTPWSDSESWVDPWSPWATEFKKPRWAISAIADLDYAQHLSSSGPNQGPASEKVTFIIWDKLEFSSNWSAVISGQGWYEGVYSQSSTYPQTIKTYDTDEIRFQDTYLQYKSDHFIARVGNQQIVWGETFGNFHADIINPKDLRYGIPLDLARVRRSTPIANLVYIHKHFSLQGIYIPQPQFNLLPLVGSDFAPPLAAMTGYSQVTVTRNEGLPIAFNNAEMGFRVSQTLGDADISLFNLGYYDRSPYYVVSSSTIPGQSLVLDERHAAVDSTGLTLAMTLGESGYVMRAEAVYTTGTMVPILDSTGALSALKTNDLNYVASVDCPTWKKTNISFQYSQDRIGDQANYLLRTSQNEDHVGLRVLLNMFEASTLETIFGYSFSDMGSRVQMEFMNPISTKMELRIGIDEYGGPSTSEAGRTPGASRAYVLLRTYFNG